MSKLLIVHGGGPTAVMNISLYGVISEALNSGLVEGVYGANNGTGGILKEDFLRLDTIDPQTRQLLKQTPGSAIGTSRDELTSDDYVKMAAVLEKNDFGYVLFNGGNGTMDTCGKLYQVLKKKNIDIKVMGIPKTTDNDISVIDHAPGFPSAAKYIAQCTRELCLDVNGLAIHVVVLEASGRNAGWITAASAAGAIEGLGPDLIYVPEIPFSEEAFIKDVEKKLKEKSGIVVVASEGLKNEQGQPVVKPIFKVGRSVYFGDVSSHLANLVIQKLGYKARAEKPGLLGRASVLCRSEVDLEEAEQVGRIACQKVLEGHSGKMVGIRRLQSTPYQCEYFTVGIEEVMMHEKIMPRHFINEAGNGVTQAYLDWLSPLLGSPITEMTYFNTSHPAEREKYDSI